eukprot:m.369310 g.369310  ORF g.369310 m.369310 type:complete len:52 (-) comp48911_c0_seq1:104-259(-)
MKCFKHFPMTGIRILVPLSLAHFLSELAEGGVRSERKVCIGFVSPLSVFLF